MEFNAKETAKYIAKSVKRMQERGIEDEWSGILHELVFTVYDAAKAPDVYVMFRGESIFEDMLELVQELFRDPDGIIFEDIDAKSFDIQISECMAPDLPEAFMDVGNPLFNYNYEGQPYATFLSLKLTDYYS